jgi:hypothetical protein
MSIASMDREDPRVSLVEMARKGPQEHAARKAKQELPA